MRASLVSRACSLTALALVAGCAVTETSTPTRDAARSDSGNAPDSGATMDSGVGATDSGIPSDAARDVVLPSDVRPTDGGCPLGLVACGDTCVSISADPSNCGACGNRCRSGSNGTPFCDDGRCAINCAASFADCDRDPANGCEVDTRTSALHCGRCNNACTISNATAACVAGACAVGACAMGFGDCDSMATNGCETMVNTTSNCGMCGRSCSGATPVCDARAGACSSGCTAGQQRCGGSCVDTTSDANHCGACDRRCAVANGTPSCMASACRVFACSAGFADCDGNAANGCEVNTRTDPMNCGGCGNRPAESCNGADDNCNGVIDEGFRAAAVGTSYTALSAQHAACNGAGERYGPSCNAAISRLCAARGCTTSGFGPVENSGDGASVVCTRADVVVTAYSTLHPLHPEGACDGTRQRMGPDCNAAINRFCAARGAVGGFGPIENSGDTAVVACVGAGSMGISTTYTMLAGLHPGCNGTSQRMGPDCNAAINRFCTARGFEGGFGPVENAGDVANVVCVGR
ncbi:MAG: hypothetical protein JNK05_27025 [Myxococcales bacterium]|nr:hypothetical protein [Myxococcales bacterium]